MSTRLSKEGWRDNSRLLPTDDFAKFDEAPGSYDVSELSAINGLSDLHPKSPLQDLVAMSPPSSSFSAGGKMSMNSMCRVLGCFRRSFIILSEEFTQDPKARCANPAFREGTR